jgi:hypothetical protein
MRENSDQSAVAQCASALVKPESTLDLAGLVSAAAALGEDVGEVELRGLALGRIAEQLGERVRRTSLWLPTGGFRAPTVDLVPCMDRSGMRAAGGGGSGCDEA